MASRYRQKTVLKTCCVSAVSGFACDSVAPTTVEVGGGALKIAADASVVSGSAVLNINTTYMNFIRYRASKRAFFYSRAFTEH